MLDEEARGDSLRWGLAPRQSLNRRAATGAAAVRGPCGGGGFAEMEKASDLAAEFGRGARYVGGINRATQIYRITILFRIASKSKRRRERLRVPSAVTASLLWSDYSSLATTHGDLHRDCLMKTDRHLVFAELLDGLVELNLAALDGVVLRGQASAMSLAVTEPKS